MQVFNKFEELYENYSGCVIALGTFDGIHLGHLDIIKTAKNYAEKNNVKSIVFSFSNHPLDLITPKKSPTRLCSEEKKKQLLEDLGIDILFNMHFDSKLLTVSSSQFVINMQRYFSPGCLVVGGNYSYGYLGAGTATTLIKDGQKYNFFVMVRTLVTANNIIVSSTNIRNYLLTGDIGKANKLLGREYSLCGKVIDGDKRGRTLGFPTANLEVDTYNQTIPGDGVYAGFARLKESTFQAVISISNNPTFLSTTHKIEVYLFDFNENIYGEKLEVVFATKIRETKKLANTDELIENIKNDVNFAKKYLQ